MKKYFEIKNAEIDSDKISPEEIESFRSKVITELKKMDALPQDIALLQDAMVRNAIKHGSKPQDVAWAIMQ